MLRDAQPFLAAGRRVTREEALANIREAITLWLEVEEEDTAQELESSGVSYSRELVTV